MTLLEIKKKVLQLIEEISDNANLTDDPDIKAKLNSVINMVQFELARMKKIPAYVQRTVNAGEVVDMNTLDNFYQLRLIRFTGSYELIEDMAVFLEDGTADIYYYKYPEAITDNTPDTYEFELSLDALEILPYGVAGDLLKSDVSAQYGAVYSQRYESMLQRLDSRYSMGGISFEGGVDI
jgi:hypothetical protein